MDTRESYKLFASIKWRKSFRDEWQNDDAKMNIGFKKKVSSSMARTKLAVSARIYGPEVDVNISVWIIANVFPNLILYKLRHAQRRLDSIY